MSFSFNALLSRGEGKGANSYQIEQRSSDDLPAHDVLIKVHYSSLNYKDALSSMGHLGITRSYPHQPGIDASGEVIEDQSGTFRPGDKVLVTGYDLGMNTAGGFGAFIRVPKEWVVALPDGLTLEEAMMLGTAGFTAGNALYAILQQHILPGELPVLVTGASGGVGCMSLGILHKVGFSVLAATGKHEHEQTLKAWGASKVISREEVLRDGSKILGEKRWCAAIDTVGGTYLEAAVKGCEYHGLVACTGNAFSDQFSLSVYPFILRGVTLQGIASASTPMVIRKEIWRNLAENWKPLNLKHRCRVIELEQLPDEIRTISTGGQLGRVVIAHRH